MPKPEGKGPKDVALVRAMAAGDEGALRMLHARYASALIALAARIVGDMADAEEIAADALWQAWRQAAGFDPNRASVGAWLVTLTRSRAIDRWRARAVRTRTQDGYRPDIEVDDCLGELYGEERRKVVSRALGALRNGERELIELAYFSDLSRSEIALRTKLPLGTVKSRLRSALAKLRTVLKESD